MLLDPLGSCHVLVNQEVAMHLVPLKLFELKIATKVLRNYKTLFSRRDGLMITLASSRICDMHDSIYHKR